MEEKAAGNEKTGRQSGKKFRVTFGIKKKLLGTLFPILVIMIGLILFNVYYRTYEILQEKSEQNLEANTATVVNEVKAWMNKTISSLEEERDAVEYFDMNPEAELEYIKHTAGRYDAYPAGMYLATTQGQLIHSSFVPGPGYSFYEKAYYIDGLKSEDFSFGEVYLDEDSQAYVVGASGVLKDSGGNVRGVAVADIYLDTISDIISRIQLEETGGMLLVDTRTNMIIGHKDPSCLGTSLDEQKDPLYPYVAQLIKSGTSGLQRYDEPAGDSLYLDLAKIPGSSWITVAYVPQREVMRELTDLTRNMILISIVGVLVLLLLVERFIHFIVKPIKPLTNALTSITDGDFTVDVQVHTKDEIGVMAAGLHRFISSMRNIITQINDICIRLNEQSASSSGIAGNLSAASESQSKSMEELNTTVGELANSISEVAGNATDLSLLVADADANGVEAGTQMAQTITASGQGRKDMRAVVDSMKDISEKMNHLESSVSQVGDSITEINAIVDLIRDIAEETNLLSLNASIEAARAGESGRGFAVVADQIGKLASTSSDAVDKIAILTGNIGNLVENTVREAVESSETIKTSAAAVNAAGENFDSIFDAIQSTDTAVSSMVGQVSQVNDVAVNVAGITEEQSAASQELLATFETLSEQSKSVYNDSREVADDARQLDENARRLEEQMRMFRV